MRYFYVFISVVCVSLQIFAQVDPKIRWSVIKSPHFDVIVDSEDLEVGQYYANRFEWARTNLSPYFPVLPDSKTLIVIDDRTDQTNGYATPFPTDMIGVYPVLPTSMDSISEFGDWALELATHEYAHILAFTPRNGAFKVLRNAFGSISTPNILLPRWMHEGLAVEMETRLSSHGRLRSHYLDAEMRALYLDQNLLNIDVSTINEVSLTSYPGGSRPYLFGAMLWSELLSQHSPGAQKSLLSYYGGRFPYLLNGPIYDLTESSYSELFSDAKKSVHARALLQVEQLKSVDPTLGVVLSLQGLEQHSPQVSPDGLKLAYIQRDETNRHRLRILTRNSAREIFKNDLQVKGLTNLEAEKDSLGGPSLPKNREDGPPGGSVSDPRWFPDSQKIIYSRVSTIHRFAEISDIWVYDLAKQKNTQLTHEMRAREPSVSPDGSRFAFVKLKSAKTQICIAQIDQPGEEKCLVNSKIAEQLSYPIFLSDRTLLFQASLPNGGNRLMQISLGDKGPVAVAINKTQIRFAQSLNGKLYFTSSENGVHNIYVRSATDSGRALTNSLTGILNFSVDPLTEEIYATQFSSTGLHIVQLRKADLVQEGVKLPQVQTLLADRYPSAELKNPTPLVYPQEEYSSASYLMPHYWLPGLYISDGQYAVSAATSVSDPLLKHQLFVSATYDSSRKDTFGYLSYTNNQTWTQLSLQLQRRRTGFLNVADSILVSGAKGQAFWQIWGWSEYLWFGLEYEKNTRTYRNVSYKENAPSLVGYFNNLSQGGEQISPEGGYKILASTKEIQATDEVDKFWKSQAVLETYWSRWLPKRHTLMTRLSGLYIQKNVPLPFYEQTAELSASGDIYRPDVLMRGYPRAFLAKTLVNTNIEYRFPLWTMELGSSTAPFFFRRLHGALVLDGIRADGFRNREDTGLFESIYSNKAYWGYGAEVKMDMTFGFHFPVTIYWGVYRGYETSSVFGLQF